MQSTSESPPRLRIFLCHSSNDKAEVRSLYAKLLEDGFEPWLDEENLLPGQDWQREIPRAVRNSDIVIVCLSRGSINKSGYIQKEIKFALDIADEQPEGTVFIIPLRLEECEVPDRLSRWQWVNFFDNNGYARLKKSLEHRADADGLNTNLADATQKVKSSLEDKGKSISTKIDDFPNSHLEINDQKNFEIRNQSTSLESKSQKPPLALVMKGGGVKGLAYVGAVKELEKFFRFNWFIGTSAGAIAAVLLGAGYATDELESLLVNKNFRDFLDAKWYKLPLNLLFKKGLFPADKFTAWIDQLLAKKLETPVRVTLGQLPFRVTIYASRRDKNALVFDSKDPKTMDIAAAFAVRCSMSIPYIFTPQMDAGLKVLDGGMRNNYPIDALLRDNPNTDFIGLYLGSEHFEGQERETSLIKDLSSIWMEATDVESLKSHLKRTVIIDPRPISTIDFSLNEDEKNFLLEAGHAAALKFLLKQDQLSDKEKSLIQAKSVDLTTKVKQNRELLTNARQKKRNRRLRIFAVLAATVLLVFIMVLWNQRTGDIPIVEASNKQDISPTPQNKNAENIRFTGRVMDEKSLKGISNAKIGIEIKGVSHTFYTDADGIFSFDSTELEHPLRLRVDIENYHLFDSNVSFSPTNISDIRLSPLKAIPSIIKSSNSQVFKSIKPKSTKTKKPVCTQEDILKGKC